MKKLSLNFLFLCSFILLNACSSAVKTEEKSVSIFPPEELYGDLFYEVQENENLFADSKTFVDAVPRTAPKGKNMRSNNRKPMLN